MSSNPIIRQQVSLSPVEVRVNGGAGAGSGKFLAALALAGFLGAFLGVMARSSTPVHAAEPSVTEPDRVQRYAEALASCGRFLSASDEDRTALAEAAEADLLAVWLVTREPAVREAVERVGITLRAAYTGDPDSLTLVEPSADGVREFLHRVRASETAPAARVREELAALGRALVSEIAPPAAAGDL